MTGNYRPFQKGFFIMQIKKEKLCKTCGEKDPEKFRKDLVSKCKKCLTLVTRNWRKNNPIKYKTNYDNYYENNLERISECSKKRSKTLRGKPISDYQRLLIVNWYKNNKEKHCASSKLCYHVKVGNVIRPKKCSVCKRKTRLSGHHKDYSKPLDVCWLCQSCHKKVHSGRIAV